MVAYITDARFCLQKTSKRGYVSLQGKSILLTPMYNWIHDCIQDCTRKWDPSLMMSTVWPNFRQGIISVLSGGKVGQLIEPDPRHK